MGNKKALNFFQIMSESDLDEKSVKLANVSDFTDIDAEFILKYANDKSNILDLGSGTGLILNKIYDKTFYIVAVEPFKGFSKFITKSKNIEIVNTTFDKFQSDKQYDLVTLFAVMHYFDQNEAIDIYTKYYNYIKPKGKIIIKNQFGITEDVNVDGYSEEQKSNYYAHYRHIEKEKKILERIGYKNIEIHDIYPPECNRWDNTHFYAIVAEKK